MSTSKLQPAMAPIDETTERRRRIRRNTWLLVAVALGFYLTFIVMSVSRGMPVP